MEEKKQKMKILFNTRLVYFVLTLAITFPCLSKWKKLEEGDDYVKYYDIENNLLTKNFDNLNYLMIFTCGYQRRSNYKK